MEGRQSLPVPRRWVARGSGRCAHRSHRESKRQRLRVPLTDDEDHSPAFEFRVNVDSTSGWPLFVKGRFNAAAGTLNYALILKTEGRICSRPW